jgi:hypothetical protein
MADTNFWICDGCGFHNKPHAFRIGEEKQERCEQCGGDQKSGHDVEPS